MSEWKLHACTKCGGDINTDPNTGEMVCLQCGNNAGQAFTPEHVEMICKPCKEKPPSWWE